MNLKVWYYIKAAQNEQKKFKKTSNKFKKVVDKMK